MLAGNNTDANLFNYNNINTFKLCLNFYKNINYLIDFKSKLYIFV